MRICLTIATLILVFSGLASCQSMTKKECAVADWQMVGQKDGAMGYVPDDRLARHVKACARIGVVPDETLWRKGYEVGLKAYCTPLSGLRNGQMGRDYHNVCPAQTVGDFARGYRLGQAEYRKEREISRTESRISELKSEIREREAELAKSQDDALRAVLRREINDRYFEIGRLESEIFSLRRELARISYAISQFRADPSKDPVVPLY